MRYLIVKHLKIISVFLLCLLAFVFLHSEFDEFSTDGDTHETHDFCRIVEKATPNLTRSVQNIILQDFTTDNTYACITIKLRNCNFLPFVDFCNNGHFLLTPSQALLSSYLI